MQNNAFSRPSPIEKVVHQNLQYKNRSITSMALTLVHVLGNVLGKEGKEKNRGVDERMGR